MIAHVAGLPVEEAVLGAIPFAGVTLAVVAARVRELRAARAARARSRVD